MIDTAGMRRQRASTEWEKLSVAAARRMLHAADCALLVVDLSDGLTHQDKRIAQLAGESDCALVVVANKTDLLPPPARKAAVRRLLDEISPEMIVEVIPLSATGKRSLPKKTLSAALHRALAARQISPSTARLNQLLQEIVAPQSAALSRARPAEIAAMPIREGSGLCALSSTATPPAASTRPIGVIWLPLLPTHCGWSARRSRLRSAVRRIRMPAKS